MTIRRLPKQTRKSKKAIESLLDLADGIRAYMSDKPFSQELEDMATRCELRATEIQRLMFEMLSLQDQSDDVIKQLDQSNDEIQEQTQELETLKKKREE